MLKVEDAIGKVAAQAKGGIAKNQVLNFILSHPGEVFRRKEIAEQLSEINENTVRAMLRDLALKEKKIGRYQVPGRTIAYYGTLEAINELSEGLRKAGVRSSREGGKRE